MKSYVSIDVATRSLAIGVYNTELLDKTLIRDSKDSSYLCSSIEPILMNVYDINEGKNAKDTSSVEKAIALKKILHQVDEFIKGKVYENVLILIEYQMNANHLSNSILNMIVYHYAGRYPVEIIKPTWKNTIALADHLKLSDFLAVSSSNYKANKSHTRENMLYFLQARDKMDMIQNVKKSNQDDIADTLCQMIAHMLKSL